MKNLQMIFLIYNECTWLCIKYKLQVMRRNVIKFYLAIHVWPKKTPNCNSLYKCEYTQGKKTSVNQMECSFAAFMKLHIHNSIFMQRYHFIWYRGEKIALFLEWTLYCSLPPLDQSTLCPGCSVYYAKVLFHKNQTQK